MRSRFNPLRLHRLFRSDLLRLHTLRCAKLRFGQIEVAFINQILHYRGFFKVDDAEFYRVGQLVVEALGVLLHPTSLKGVATIVIPCNTGLCQRLCLLRLADPLLKTLAGGRLGDGQAPGQLPICYILL